MGYSVGKWEGDTLGVETTGFRGRSWLDLLGHRRSESMRITERYRRRDFGHMDLEITFDDPKYHTRPFAGSRSKTHNDWCRQLPPFERGREENRRGLCKQV
jgi:hypothetical protein